MKMTLLKVLALVGFLGLSIGAHATPVVQVVASDTVYGTFNGSLQSGATGAADTLTWSSAGYGVTFNLYFTNAYGIITDVLSTSNNDIYKFSGFLSGNSAIGMTCSAAGSTACLITTGQFQDILPIITGFNGGSGVCCGASTVKILVNDAPVPEPASLLLFGTALIGVGLARRRASRTV